MFVQVIHGKLTDSDLWQRQMDAWRDDIRPGAIGFLGSTGGITEDGRIITVARFADAAAAQANSNRPEQGAWFAQTAKAVDGEPTFHDCSEVDTLLDGGSDSAGFVQIMEGHVADKAKFRAGSKEMEAQLREIRPDLLGATLAWHDDDEGAFTQASYFRSEAEARKNEQAMADSPMFTEFMSMLDGDLTFYDLKDATFN